MTAAQAHVFAPLSEEERVRLAEAAHAAGGLAKVSAPALRRLLDEQRGHRRVAAEAVAWDRRTVSAARSALRRLERAHRPTWADADALRALPPAEAAAVRAEVSEALRDVGAARRLTEPVLETLNAARSVLDGRGDLPAAPGRRRLLGGLRRLGRCKRAPADEHRDVLDQIAAGRETGRCVGVLRQRHRGRDVKQPLVPEAARVTRRDAVAIRDGRPRLPARPCLSD
jgi:hypothetical protein